VLIIEIMGDKSQEDLKKGSSAFTKVMADRSIDKSAAARLDCRQFNQERNF
jgi:hypothetical protein